MMQKAALLRNYLIFCSQPYVPQLFRNIRKSMRSTLLSHFVAINE